MILLGSHYWFKLPLVFITAASPLNFCIYSSRKKRSKGARAANQCRPRAYASPLVALVNLCIICTEAFNEEWWIEWTNAIYTFARPTCNNQIFSVRQAAERELLLPRHKTCNSKSSMKIDGNKTSERSERDKSAFICSTHIRSLRERDTASYLFIFYLCTYTHTRINACNSWTSARSPGKKLLLYVRV
jgi:hypothetical protein